MSKHTAVLAIAMILGASAVAEGDIVKNTKVIVQAARSLKFSLREHRAYLLFKSWEAIPGFMPAGSGEVAVIWGFGDNRSACKDIARGMGTSYECSPVY